MPQAHATEMALLTRSSELHSVLASMQVTDASGNRLDSEESILQILELLRDLRRRNGNLYLVGNGGSAAVASHSVTDFLNVGRLRAATIHDSSLLTCMANDYGYESAFARILSVLAQPGDVLIAISSSGKSPNIRNAAAKVRELGGAVITLSGFASDNPLRALGNLNIWLNARDYGMVEIGHQFVLHNIADRLRSKAKHVER
ncbi:MAG: D-sedoheptulose-7-phosphate isomerase [Nitrospiraceae bacterium]